MSGAIHDWLDLAEQEAKRRGHEFNRRPLTSKATFLIEDLNVAGKVRRSIRKNRGHDRIWLNYDHERTFIEKAHFNSRIITVALDIFDANQFSPDTDDFIIVCAEDREKLPGGEELEHKFYSYIGDNGDHYYNHNNNKKYLPKNSWNAVFQR